jgi:hypothetical protein
MATNNPFYGTYREQIYASINGTKGNMVKLRKSSLLTKNEKEKVTNVINALESLRQELIKRKELPPKEWLENAMKRITDDIGYSESHIERQRNLLMEYAVILNKLENI